MLAASDPAAFVALIFLLLLGLVSLRLRHVDRRRRQGQRRLAERVGHPSTFVAAGHTQAAAVAAGLAESLASMGLICDRTGGRVWAQGLAGEYVLTVIGHGVHVTYRTAVHGDRRATGHELYLGYFPTVDAGLREIARHGELRAPA